MIRGAILTTIITCLLIVSGSNVFGLDEKKQHDGLLKNMGKAKITLQQGLGMAESQGQPISAKFELENDTEFQLSVFTAKAGKFAEVIVDYGNGKLSKPEAITQGEDLSEAKSEIAAMAKAKITLKAALDKAVSQSEGYRAISIFPSLKDGHPVGVVVLLKDNDFKTVEIPLE
jgi:hypothetical protein